MTTLAIGYVTSIIKNAIDPTKINVQLHIMGFGDPSHESDLVKVGADPYLSVEQFETLCTDAIKQYSIDYFGYSYTGSDDVRVLGACLPMTPSAASRSLNTAFQISTSRHAVVSYSVDIATTLSLSGGQTGTVFLEYADNSGMSTNLVEVCRSVNGNTGTLTIGLNITQNCTGQVSGVIPAGKYVRIRTVNTTGTPAFNYRSGQEALL